MAELSGNFLYAAFLVYLIAVPIFGGAIRGNKDKRAGKTDGPTLESPFLLSGLFATLGISSQGGLPAAMRRSAICLNSPPLLA